MTTGEGGIVSIPDASTYEKAKILRDHGMDPQKRYWHIIPGSNYRMTAMQASLGRSQLKNLNASISHKSKIFQWYIEYLDHSDNYKLYYNEEVHSSSNPPWLVTIFLNSKAYSLDDRNYLMQSLLSAGIETRPSFYPLSSMPCYKQYCTNFTYDNSRESLVGLSLPFFDFLTRDEVRYICKQINDFF